MSTSLPNTATALQKNKRRRHPVSQRRANRMFALANDFKALQSKYPELYYRYIQPTISNLLKQAVRDRRKDRTSILRALDEGAQTMNDLVVETKLSRRVLRSQLEWLIAQRTIERAKQKLPQDSKGRPRYIYSRISPMLTKENCR